MKAWTTAAVHGRCAFCGTAYAEGARVVLVQGTTWRKVYCGPCGQKHHGMSEDTGEVLDLTDHPSYPTALEVRGGSGPRAVRSEAGGIRLPEGRSQR